MPFRHIHEDKAEAFIADKKAHWNTNGLHSTATFDRVQKGIMDAMVKLLFEKAAPLDPEAADLGVSIRMNKQGRYLLEVPTQLLQVYRDTYPLEAAHKQAAVAASR